METKKLKLRVHYRNFSKEELIVNCEALSKEKWEDGDLLEIFSPDDHARTWRSHLILQVKTLSPDIQSKGGPFSILQDTAVAFNLTGVREVCVRKVDQREVGLDLVELSFKDQYITRSDMWRITCSLLNRCLYSGKHLEHCSMRMQTYCLWYQGEKVTSGAVVNSTRVVFRSASAHVFLFIQISSEMWDFDPNGEFFFDKTVNGFLRDLFAKWKEAGCNHDVTIVFFWRLHYDPSSLESLPTSPSIRGGRKSDLLYEDFFRVIVESTSNSDWSCELINIKKSFLKLKPLIQSLRGSANAELCKSEEGNILEAINLALNVLERHNVDTNVQLSGQQIVVLTAGTGYFEIDRELMQLTNERLVYGGVTTDVVSMRDQPLHAMPMFKFHSKEEEFFSIPHWINYSFYNPPQARGQTGFQPRIYLSDHLVNTYLQKDKSDKTHTLLYNPNTANPSTKANPQIRTWVDYDKHDDAIFNLPNSRLSKVQSSCRMTGGKGRGQLTREGSDGSPSENKPVTFRMGDSPTDMDPFDGEDETDSTSPSPNPNSIETKQYREEHFTRSEMPARQRYKSENFGDAAVDKLDASSGTKRDRAAFVSVGSAEVLRQLYTPWGSYRNVGSNRRSLQKKRLSFSNPFDPNKMHTEAPAFQRRWAHVFPTNKRGVAFQIHHATAQESQLENSSLQSLEDVVSTPQSSLKRKGILKHSFNALTTTLDSSVTGTSQNGSFNNENLGGSLKKTAIVGAKQSPSNSSLREEDHLSLRGIKKQKGSPSLNSSYQVTATPEAMRRQRERWNDQFLSSNTLNFPSVRRTGVDWVSLVEPAHLPVTTDFYPAKEILDRDYAQYNTNLVVFRDDQGEGREASNEKKPPVWHSDHSTMTTFQAFQEMISQRLSQGFQLTYPPPSERGGSLQGGGPHHRCKDLNSVYVLYEAVERLKAAMVNKNSRHRPNDSITVHMGLSSVFQKLVLAFQDISVFIYRQKSSQESQPWMYTYQLSSAQDEEFQMSSCQFAITSDDYNWNFLDNHVCGYPDFDELGESLHYWELRYLLLPKQCPTFPPLCASGEQRRQEEETLISNFVRFLEFLNRIKKSRKFSAQSSNRRNSFPARKIKPSRSSLPPFESPTSLTSPRSLSPITTPTHSHTPTSHSRQLSEIEEEEEKNRSAQKDHEPPSVKNDTKKTDSKPGQVERERGGKSCSKPEAKSARVHRDNRRQSADAEGVLRKTRSRDSLVQMDRGSRSRPESPTLTPQRDISKYSPLTERRRIVNKLKRFASEDSSSAGDSGVEKPQPPPSSLSPSVSTSVSSQMRETDIETSLDYNVEGVMQEGVPRIEEPLHINSPLIAIQQAMENENDGIDFLGSQPGLRKGCFIAMDAVKWMVDTIRGVRTRKQAVTVLQSMIHDRLIVHASEDMTVPFLDGYFIYCMPRKEGQEDAPKEILDSSLYIVNSDFDSFSKKWFETEFKFPSSTAVDSADGSDSPSSPHSLASSFKAGHSYYMGFEHTEETYIPPSILNRRVELNPDPHFHSSRPEWCYVYYDPVYNPSEAFQLKFQWMVATTNLLSTLIQSWVRNASMCDFNLVPVPVHKSLLQDHRSTHPFRKPSFIPLSLPAAIEEKWREEDAYSMVDKMRQLLLAVANKNGFLQDCAQLPPDPDILSPRFANSPDQTLPHFYVHHTGTALVQLVVEVPGTTEQQPDIIISPTSSMQSRSMWRGSHQLLDPYDATSTPLTQSPARPGGARSNGSISSEGDSDKAEDGSSGVVRLGFFWHKNYLLPKQKNVPPSLVASYDGVLERLTKDCHNSDRVLNELCDRLFT